MIFPLACLLLLIVIVSRSPLRSRLVATMADPERMGALMKLGAALFFILSAVVVFLRGHVEVALLLLGGGLWLFNLSGKTKAANAKPQQAPPNPSRVRTAMIEMEFNATTGVMRGLVLAGPEEGQSLDALTRARCEAVYRQCRDADREGARLLEVYLDRRFAGWRQAGESDRDARRDRVRHPNRMSENEAYEVLGLPRGATRDEVVRTHRALMKKLHPDQGGSTALAARVNEAKEVLMRRHF